MYSSSSPNTWADAPDDMYEANDFETRCGKGFALYEEWIVRDRSNLVTLTVSPT